VFKDRECEQSNFNLEDGLEEMHLNVQIGSLNVDGGRKIWILDVT
jgi:hypothetical protein